MSKPAPAIHGGTPGRTRGACPRLAEPMETGDGLLARIVPSGAIPIDEFAALCAAARTHGNGLMEVTARGSLQIRGLGEASAPLFAAAVEALNFPFDDEVPVLASPLSPWTGAMPAQEMAMSIRHGISATGLRLAPKVSVTIDDGGPISLDGLRADIRLRANPSRRDLSLAVSIGGDGESAIPLGWVEQNKAAALAVDLLSVLAERGPDIRAKAVLAEEGVAPFLQAIESRLNPVQDWPHARTTETIGLHRLQGEDCAIGVALPFGQAHALDLIALARIAGANGAGWVALAPQRTLLLGPIGEMTAFALGTAADTLGFVVDARDARRRIAACAGAPACTSGFIPARELASRIAEQLPQGGFALHISGCAKGCAHPKPAPFTLLGTAQGVHLIEGETVRFEGSAPRMAEDLVAEAARAIASESHNA